MLELESERWSELEHAYGTASDMPALLRLLRGLPVSGGQAEPWFSLWSALAHQGDVYSASFAAVPHVIHAMAGNPQDADDSFFHFPAWIEICRVKQGVAIPPDLQGPYFESLARLPSLVAVAAEKPWGENRLACMLCALAAAKGHHAVAEAVLELSEHEVATKFLDGFFQQ